MLTIDNSLLAVVDVQGKLAQLMHDRDRLFQNLGRIIQGAQALGLPMLWVEQNPTRLGPTISELATLLAPLTPIPKLTFSAMGEARFREALAATGRRQVLLAGIETHVCIYQTARDLLYEGYEVEVVADAVSSRAPENKQIGLQKIRDLSMGLTSVEMALFELAGIAEGDVFKTLLQIVK